MSKVNIDLFADLRATAPDKLDNHAYAIKSILKKASEDIYHLTQIRVTVEAFIDKERFIHTSDAVFEIDTVRIILACCSAFGITTRQLMEGGRKGVIPDCRKAIAYLCVKKYRVNNYSGVASALGLSDHTTVITQVRKCLDFLAVDNTFNDRFFKAIEILERQ